jgi:hypothetical protein
MLSAIYITIVNGITSTFFKILIVSYFLDLIAPMLPNYRTLRVIIIASIIYTLISFNLL